MILIEELIMNTKTTINRKVNGWQMTNMDMGMSYNPTMSRTIFGKVIYIIFDRYEKEYCLHIWNEGLDWVADEPTVNLSGDILDIIEALPVKVPLFTLSAFRKIIKS
jgi:hypothetical protein